MKPKLIVCVNLRSILYEDRYHGHNISLIINGAKEFILGLQENYDIIFYCDENLWLRYTIPFFLRDNFGKEFKLFVGNKIPVADFYVGNNYIELPINSDKEDFKEVLTKINIKSENLL